MRAFGATIYRVTSEAMPRMNNLNYTLLIDTKILDHLPERYAEIILCLLHWYLYNIGNKLDVRLDDGLKYFLIVATAIPLDELVQRFLVFVQELCLDLDKINL